MTKSTYYIVVGNKVEAHPYRHPTFESASAESKRLARTYKGTVYTVFKAIEANESPQDIQTTQFDDIPF